ncbi:hypothetical protein A2U01_0022040 [Trifolium medium]|uniref:Uncharacterized protein n=1 Tax=Trifolium medium TaxID=97028 RepID=A0A392NPK9_9FABA|nr:hypothetical protein [Trifolium medium]
MQRSLAHYSREGIRWIGIPSPERLRHAKEDSWENQMRCDLDEVTIMNFPALVCVRDNMWMKNSIQRLTTDWLTGKMNQCSKEVEGPAILDQGGYCVGEKIVKNPHSLVFVRRTSVDK